MYIHVCTLCKKLWFVKILAIFQHLVTLRDMVAVSERITVLRNNAGKKTGPLNLTVGGILFSIYMYHGWLLNMLSPSYQKALPSLYQLAHQCLCTLNPLWAYFSSHDPSGDRDSWVRNFSPGIMAGFPIVLCQLKFILTTTACLK